MTRALLSLLLVPLLLVGPPARADVDVSADRPATGDRLLERIERLDIVDSVREISDGLGQTGRYFRIWVRLPVDHHDPDGPTFRLRVTLQHVGTDRPVVLQTGGYGLWSWDLPFRDELTSIVRGNQIDVEHRFFEPSRPRRPDWPSQLTIEQSAADQHRIVRAFQRIYTRPWLTTGASKGGMTMTYYRRFYPSDVAGTVALVAPNDAVDTEDAYDDFLTNVGGDSYAGCRARLVAVQRRLLTDREWYVGRLERLAEREGLSLRLIGSADRAVEFLATDIYFGFWQYQFLPDACRRPPRAAATRREVWGWADEVYGWYSLTDRSIRHYVPYYYQAATQLGAPAPYETQVADLLRYPGENVPASFLPAALLPVAVDPAPMADVDAWVRSRGRRMLFVYGGFDPWSAEPFACGPDGAARECVRYVDPGGNHGAGISTLPRAKRRAAIRMVRRWAGLTTSNATLAAVDRRLTVGAARHNLLREHLRRIP